jgi:hypothetical protein
MMGYPSERLFEEVAYLAYYLHWPYREVMAFEHPERRRWVDEVARINERLNEEMDRGN